MTNYRNTTVIRLNGINDPNLIERDDQFQMGTITLEVGAKVRIMWDGTNTPEFAFKSMLTKWENGTFLYTFDTSKLPGVLAKPVNTDKEQELREISELLKPVNSDSLPFKDMRDETDEELNGNNTDNYPHFLPDSDKAVQEELSAEMQAEPDLNDNSDNEDYSGNWVDPDEYDSLPNTDNENKPSVAALSKQLGTLLTKPAPKPRTRRTAKQ